VIDLHIREQREQGWFVFQEGAQGLDFLGKIAGAFLEVRAIFGRDLNAWGRDGADVLGDIVGWAIGEGYGGEEQGGEEEAHGERMKDEG
jgi:hypothetical protein